MTEPPRGRSCRRHGKAAAWQSRAGGRQPRAPRIAASHPLRSMPPETPGAARHRRPDPTPQWLAHRRVWPGARRRRPLPPTAPASAAWPRCGQSRIWHNSPVAPQPRPARPTAPGMGKGVVPQRKPHALTAPLRPAQIQAEKRPAPGMIDHRHRRLSPRRIGGVTGGGIVQPGVPALRRRPVKDQRHLTTRGQTTCHGRTSASRRDCGAVGRLRRSSDDTRSSKWPRISASARAPSWSASACNSA